MNIPEEDLQAALLSCVSVDDAVAILAREFPGERKEWTVGGVRVTVGPAFGSHSPGPKRPPP